MQDETATDHIIERRWEAQSSSQIQKAYKMMQDQTVTGLIIERRWQAQSSSQIQKACKMMQDQTLSLREDGKLRALHKFKKPRSGPSLVVCVSRAALSMSSGSHTCTKLGDARSACHAVNFLVLLTAHQHSQCQ